MIPIKLWTDKSLVEESALKQLENIASLPWVFHHVAVMPDVHYGKGATVGSVIAMKDAVSPAAVGVDIGCGMIAARTNLKASDLPDNLKAIRHQIERDIPVSHNEHRVPQDGIKDFTLGDAFTNLTPEVHYLRDKAMRQLGTLGGGNHFIELCLDTQQNVWMMLHSGSRNIGKTLADIHINKAKTLAHNADLPDKDLAVFLSKTPEMAAYRNDLFWAQVYAAMNRRMLLHLYFKALKRFFPQIELLETVACHHNYVSEETHFGEDVIITRKGAIDAGLGVMGIIPGSMGAKSFIVKGRGNPDSFCSASHGAGRKMSRTAAKKKFTKEDLAQQTLGVECRKDDNIVDEIPAAYKSIDEVMKNQSDLVTIIYELKQVLCVKG